MDGHGRQVEAIERVRAGGVLEQRRLLSEYLPSGELRRVIQRRSGSPDVVRRMRYDSLGRMVLNAEPNASTGFSPDPATDPSAIKAWRYAYNDAGDVVGASDARGFGVNYHYDAAGRLLADDDSPCPEEHAAYSPPNVGAGTDGRRHIAHEGAWLRAYSARPSAARSVASRWLPYSAGHASTAMRAPGARSEASTPGRTGPPTKPGEHPHYGSTESNYRPERWGSVREPYKFTGKEEDVEVGLAYFGARYLSLGLAQWMSADPVTIHRVRSDINAYAYVMGRPLVAIDPRGEELFIAIGIGLAIGAVVAGGTSAVVQYATTGSIDWLSWDGVLGAAVIGGIAGGVSGGVGAAVGGLFSSPAAGAIAGGAAGGASGAGAAYLATWGLAAARGRRADFSSCGDTAFSLCGLGLSVLIGGVVGAGSGALGHYVGEALSGDPAAPGSKVADAPDIEFDSAEDAAAWAGRRYHDATWKEGFEYGGAIYKNKNGNHVLGDIYKGEISPEGARVVSPHFVNQEGLTPAAGWHTHPRGVEVELFSEGHWGGPNSIKNTGGDLSSTQRYAEIYGQPEFRTYMVSPARNLSSISSSGPMPGGVSHGSLWIPRLAPAAGAVGFSGAPAARKLWDERQGRR